MVIITLIPLLKLFKPDDKFNLTDSIDLRRPALLIKGLEPLSFEVTAERIGVILAPILVLAEILAMNCIIISAILNSAY